MKDELFKKVYIKSEDDLPKIGGNYFFGYKNPNRFDSCSYGAVHYVSSYGDHQFWMKEVDWYLQPIDSEYRNQGMPDDEEIEKYVDSLIKNPVNNVVLKKFKLTEIARGWMIYAVKNFKQIQSK